MKWQPKQWQVWLVSGLVAVGLGLWLAWRFWGPVEVDVASAIEGDLPFVVETFPAVVWAQPGQTISVTYRIYNQNPIPLEAYGTVSIGPSYAKDQIQIFLTQCSGLNTFQNSVAENYEVWFRVEPAGLFGASRIVLLHTFTRASLR